MSLPLKSASEVEGQVVQGPSHDVGEGMAAAAAAMDAGGVGG